MAAAHRKSGREPAKPRALDLPQPSEQCRVTLLEALKARRSSREFSPKELPLQVLSDLLWAAFGINRPQSGGRTAPSAHDWEEIEVYAALKSGLYVYRPKEHMLAQVSAEDVRSRTGTQDFVGRAPLDLVYVADLSRMTQASEEEKRGYSGPDAGFIAQNVCLFCASAGLATVVRGSVDRAALAKALRLRPEQQIILAQTVGYPA
jgi:SagB-type dehydrogenase family enzyme